MKKKIFILILIMISLSSCGNKEIKNINTTIDSAPKENGNSQDNNKQVVSEILKVEKTIKYHDVENLKKNNPEILKNYEDYNKEISRIGKKFNISNKDTEKLLDNVGFYIIKYDAIKKNINKDNTNLEKKLGLYKNFIDNNKKGIDVDINDILNNINDIKNVYSLKNEIKDYILPDGTITDLETRKEFDSLYKNGNYGDISPEIASSQFMQTRVLEDLIIEGKCDIIENPIDKAYCEGLK